MIIHSFSLHACMKTVWWFAASACVLAYTLQTECCVMSYLHEALIEKHAQQLHDNSMVESICVVYAQTHRLVQVAAYADHHLCVRKTTDLDGRVHTHIANLESHHDRAQEVAAMLGMSNCVLSSCHADVPIFTLMFCAFNAFDAFNAFSLIDTTSKSCLQAAHQRLRVEF